MSGKYLAPVLILYFFLVSVIIVFIWACFYNKSANNTVKARYLGESTIFDHNEIYQLKIYTKENHIVVRNFKNKTMYIPYTSLEELNKDWKIVY